MLLETTVLYQYECIWSGVYINNNYLKASIFNGSGENMFNVIIPYCCKYCVLMFLLIIINNY